MEMSGKEENLKKQARRMNQPIPDRILNKPLLGVGLMLYYDAFLQLQNDRNKIGFIPWSVKVEWADRFDLSEIQTERLIYFTTSLDGCYIKWSSKNRGKSHGNPD